MILPQKAQELWWRESKLVQLYSMKTGRQGKTKMRKVGQAGQVGPVERCGHLNKSTARVKKMRKASSTERVVRNEPDGSALERSQAPLQCRPELLIGLE